MYEVRLAVVPKRARVDQPFAAFHEYRFAPWPSGIFCFNYINTKIRVGIVNVEFAFVEAYCGCPHAVSMLRFLEMFDRHLPW
ncbi:hypothetical protein D3C87_1997810 [compost metagenome]